MPRPLPRPPTVRKLHQEVRANVFIEAFLQPPQRGTRPIVASALEREIHHIREAHTQTKFQVLQSRPRPRHLQEREQTHRAVTQSPQRIGARPNPQLHPACLTRTLPAGRTEVPTSMNDIQATALLDKGLFEGASRSR